MRISDAGAREHVGTRSAHLGAPYRPAEHRALQLQRTAGNAATVQLLARRTAAPVQREEEPTSSGKGAAWFAKFLQARYNQVVKLANAARFAAAKVLVTEHSREAAALKVLRRKVRSLQNRVRGGGGTRKVLARLAAAEQQLAQATQAWTQQRSLAAEANRLVREEAALVRSASGRLSRTVASVKRAITLRIGTYATRFAALLARYRAGQTVLRGARLLTNRWVSRAAVALAGVLEAHETRRGSEMSTEAGRTAHGVASGAATTGVVLHPALLAGDLLAPKGYKPSEMYRGGTGAVTAIAEGLSTGETAGMESFHEASKAGKYGKVMALASEAGDFWADRGIVGGLKEFGREIRSLF